MAFELSRIDRLEKTYDIASRFPDLDGPFTAADVALLPPRSAPNAATVWEPAGVVAGVATVLFAGPDADSSGAVVVTGSADLWMRVTVGAETDAVKIERITLLGGGAVMVGLPAPFVSSVNGATGAVTLDAADVGAVGVGAGAGGFLSGEYPSPGVNDTALVAAMAGHVGDGSAFDLAQRAAFDAKTKSLTSSPLLSPLLTGKISCITVGTAGAFDAGFVESPCVDLDPITGKLAMLYTAYDKVSGDPTAVASHGLAYSDDGINWTKSGQALTGSGVNGDPDAAGVTGAVWFFRDGLFHLFYIGLTAVGYEGGTKSLCYATATSLAGPWTRHGAVISPDASLTAIWRGHVVQHVGRYYLFFNATDGAGKERCHYATATALAGPWTVGDVGTPVLPDAGHTTDFIWGGDPCITREGDHWRMDFAQALVSSLTGDWYATTTDDAFPLGWTVRQQTTSIAAGHLAKPWMLPWKGRLWHYGTGPTGGAQVMYFADDDKRTAQTVSGRWKFNPTAMANGDASVEVGDAASGSTVPTIGAGVKQVAVIGTGADAAVTVGQGKNNALLTVWKYNATAASAFANIETYGGANEIRLQNNPGSLRLGGTGGKLGFFGTTPILKRATTADATDLATAITLANALKADLVAYGLKS